MILEDIERLLQEEADVITKTGGVLNAGATVLRNPLNILNPFKVYRSYKTGQTVTGLGRLGLQVAHQKIQQAKMARQFGQQEPVGY